MPPTSAAPGTAARARHHQAKTIFARALEAPRATRDALVRSLTGDDRALRDEVEALLAADRDADDEAFITGALLDDVDPRVAAASGRTHIGPFRLLRRIGRGGMGTVYLGERSGDFDQRVAIKLIRRGMDTEDILVRFRHERRILARLAHPHIARLLDGGTTDDGRPYFVMEYVEGRPLTQHCAQQRIDFAARYTLALKICDAVAHAHRNLIVHLDLKPANILVEEDGTPKLLDFGIAKLLDAPDD
ncbi:MAG: serine/threonine-protein kinase, partial [Acidobacteriota bacterium]